MKMIQHQIVSEPSKVETIKRANKLGKVGWKGVSLTFHPFSHECHILMIKETVKIL